MARRRITPVLDILVMLTVALGLFLTLIFALRVQPTFVRMFQDFGGELPRLTQWMLQPWPMLAFALLPLVAWVAAPNKEGQAGPRTAVLIPAIALSLVGVPLFLFAMYMPLMAMRSQVQ